MSTHRPRPLGVRCIECGGGLKGACHRVLGQWYCGECAATHCERSSCHQCHRTLWIRKGDALPTCGRCRLSFVWEGQACVRCHGPLTVGRRRRLPDGTAACAKCARYFLPPKICSVCGESSFHCARDYALGFVEPACSGCRNKRANLPCCHGCHRPRHVAGERDGHPYCADCLPTGAPPVISCRDCGKQRPNFGDQRCEDCAWDSVHQRLLDKLLPTFDAPWARDLFSAYHQAMRGHILKGNLSRAMRKDLPFFQQLGRAFSGLAALSSVAIVRKLGFRVVFKHDRAMAFLAAQGHIAIDDDPDYRLEIHIDRIRDLCKDDPEWVQSLLRRFLSHLLHLRDKMPDRSRRRFVPMAPKSLESAMRASRAFLLHACAMGVESVPELTQESLDLFLCEQPRMNFRIRSFLRYLRRHERSFHRLSIRTPKKAFPAHHLLPEKKRLALIQRFSQATVGSDLRWSLIGLFALLYAQPPHKSARLLLDDVRMTEAGYEIRFAKVPIELCPEANILLDRWLGEQREISAIEPNGSSRFLFPGKSPTTSIQPASMSYWRQKLNVTSRDLVSTAIGALIAAGVQQPRLLVDAFGLSLPTAVIYFNALGSNLQKASAHARRRLTH